MDNRLKENIDPTVNLEMPIHPVDQVLLSLSDVRDKCLFSNRFLASV